MPTISTVSAGAIAAFGIIRDANKTVTTLTDVEIIHNYSSTAPSIVDGRLYVSRIFGGTTQIHNTYEGISFYYEFSLTTAITNCIFKIKGDRYFFANAESIISELLPTLGWDNYRYTADWEGVDVDNPSWVGEVTNNPDWAGSKVLNLQWQGVITNTPNWIGELVLNNNWNPVFVDAPNWSAPIIENSTWAGALVDNPSSSWEAPLVDNPSWTQTYTDNPDWTAPIIDNPNWVQTYTDNPNWTAPLIDNPDPAWEDPIIDTPNWQGEAIYDEEGGFLGYDTSNPQLSNGGKMYEGRTEANEGLIYEGRTEANLGIIADPRTEGNLGLIPEPRTPANNGRLPDARTEGNLGLIREGRTEANGGLVRDLNVTRTLANLGLIYEGRTEANGGIIIATRTEANQGLIRDTSNPNTSNGGQYYDLAEARTLENGGFNISFDDVFRTKENGGLIYNLAAERTLENNGVIHSIAGEYRTVENGGLVYKERTIENGAFTVIWKAWAFKEGIYTATYYTTSNELIGSKLYPAASFIYGSVYDDDLELPAGIFSTYLRIPYTGIVYSTPIRLITSSQAYNFENGGIVSGAYLSAKPGKVTLGEKVWQHNTSHRPLNSSVFVSFIPGAELDTPNPNTSNYINASDGSFEKYNTDSSGKIVSSSRFDGEHWYSFSSTYADVLKGNGSYTIELFVKPAMESAAVSNFAPPYSSAEIAREAAVGIISLSDGLTSDRWILSIAPYKLNGNYCFQFERISSGEDDIFMVPIAYTEGAAWHHIAITYDETSKNLCFYLNGTLICKIYRPVRTQISSNATLDVGVRNTVGSSKSGVFNGRIKDLRIVGDNAYSSGETAGQITVPSSPLSDYYYNQMLLTFKQQNYFISPNSVMAPEGVAQFNRPLIKDVKVVGVYAEKVLIEYVLESFQLITKTYISLQENSYVPDSPDNNLFIENQNLLNTSTIYPGNRTAVTVLEEISVVANRCYHFSILAASSAGTAQSNIYQFITPSL
jgi:hypothetical protein